MDKKQKSDYINFREIFSQYLSKWYLFAISIAVFGVVGYLYTRTKNPIYGVRANVLIQQENNSLISNYGSLGDMFGSGVKVDDQIFIITSHTVYRDVARNLQINKIHYVKTGFLKHKLAYPDFPVDVTAPESITDTLSATLGFKVKVNEKGIADIQVKYRRHTIAELNDVALPTNIETPFGEFLVKKTDFYPEGKDVSTTIAYSGYNATAEQLSEDIISDIPSRKGNVIALGIDTQNPQLGSAIINDIIDIYNQNSVKESNNHSARTLEFINERLGLISQDLNSIEDNIRKYKDDNNVFALEVELKYQNEKRGKIEEKLLEAQTKAAEIKFALDFIRQPGNEYSPISIGTDNDGVGKAIEAYNELIYKHIELADATNGSSIPLRQLEKQIDAMRSNLESTIANSYKNAEVAVSKIKAEQGNTSDKLGSLPTQELELRDLYRQREIKQQLYLYLLRRQEETSIMLVNALPKGIVVDEAYTLSQPLSVSKSVILLLFLIIGVLVPPIFLYLRKLIRNRFDSRFEVERNLSVPILGEMCADRSGNSLVVTAKEHTSSSELFRLIRSNLLFMLNNASDKVVLMTSSTSGEGKSFISVNLAASLAILGKKVLLVGMDIRKPKLAEYLDLHPQFGLTQYLSSDSIALDSIISPVESVAGLDVITAGPVPPNPAELLESDKIDRLFEQLRSMYDYIIVDTAPVGMVSDTFTLARISDATVYVCRVNHTPLTDLRFIEEIYEEKRLKKLSVVVNGTTSKKAYGYGYGNNK